MIRDLTQVLDVSIGDLIGEPMLRDWTADSRTQTVPALRAVLRDYSRAPASKTEQARSRSHGKFTCLCALRDRSRYEVLL